MIGQHRIVALLMSRAYEGTNYEMIEGLNRLITAQGDRLFIYHSCSDFEKGHPEEMGEAKIYEMMPFDVIDAAIIYEESLNDKDMVKKVVGIFRERKVPVAIIGKPYDGCMQFEFDYETGFEKVVRHMVEFHGYRDIIFVSGVPGNDYSEVRENILIRVLKENGIAFNKETNLYYGYYWDMPAREVAMNILDRGRMPEAIICANDSMAVAICDELLKAGIKVPADVAMSGFDGIDEIYYSAPQMTSCKCDYEVLATDVATALYDYLANPTGDFVGSKKVPAELVCLSSCGCNFSAKTSAVEEVSTLDLRVERCIDREMKFFNMTRRMTAATTLEELRAPMYNEYMKDICCFLNPKVLEDIPYFMEKSESGLKYFGNEIPTEYALLFDSDLDENEYPDVVKRDDIHPIIEKFLERDIPIVFNVLHISDSVLGMIMLHPDWKSIENMYAIPQIVIALRTAISGYQMLGNQRYLSDQLLNMYKRDELTGFLLRKSLDTEFLRVMKDLKKRKRKLGILLADLDGLKNINDNFGHSEGDVAILTVAKAVYSALPTSAVCFRYGGDEMLAVFEVNKDISIVYDDIAYYLKRYNENAGKEYLTDVSVGISIDTEPGSRELEDMIKEADDIMYSRKINKKNHRD